MDDPTLREKWERTSTLQPPRTQEEQDLDLYFDISERSQRDDRLKAIMERLNADIAAYAEALFRNEQEWVRRERGLGDKEAIESSDRHRRMLHDAFMDTLNQLSRAFRAQKLDNKWRNVLGLDRNRLAKWAMTIARYVIKKEERT
jgi:flagellar biosynthesis/type III secretory pathway protein FliH